MKSIDELIADPAWFPDTIYVEQRFLDCHKVSRPLLEECSFLDQRMTARCSERTQVAFSYEILDEIARKPMKCPVNFIFHTSFCRSTLMAQALHMDGISFSLKEPGILLSLAESCRQTWMSQDPGKAKQTFEAILRLITGLAIEGESIVIKPTNLANNLLPYALASGRKVLLMYSDLRSFLVSILKYGERGRAFSRHLYTRLKHECDFFKTMDQDQALLLTDLKIAALAWKKQMSAFTVALNDAKPGQVCTLDSAAFSANKPEVLSRVYEFFDIPASRDQVESIASGPVFQRHSKNKKDIDDAEILQQRMDLEDRFRDDIETTLAWAGSISFASHLTLPLWNDVQNT